MSSTENAEYQETYNLKTKYRNNNIDVSNSVFAVHMRI